VEEPRTRIGGHEAEDRPTASDSGNIPLRCIDVIGCKQRPRRQLDVPGEFRIVSFPGTHEAHLSLPPR
jgi:hypothetical protein